MITTIAMGIIVLALAFMLIYKIKIMPTTDHFFDKNNSVAMRGFWCLIVIIVHTPVIFQNTIQDLIGSFAYIGVTFYFMTSSYGLKLTLNKNPGKIKSFWQNRLPKLIIPMLLSNIVVMIGTIIRHGKTDISYIIHFNKWVLWLLVCYFIFWIVYRFINIKNIYRDIIISIAVIAFSITIYIFKDHINQTTWCTEVFGFIWGIVLSNVKNRFSQSVNKKWLRNSIALCIVSAVLGVAYLKFKPVIFFGDYLLKIVLGISILLLILAVNLRFNIGNKISIFLGKISYEIFLLHGMAFSLVAYFCRNIAPGLGILITILITVLLSWVVNIASNKIYSLFMTLQKIGQKDKLQ